MCFLSTVKFRRNCYYAVFFYFSLGHERFIRVIKLKKLYKYKVGGLNADEDDDEDHEEEEGGDSDKEDSAGKRYWCWLARYKLQRNTGHAYIFQER